MGLFDSVIRYFAKVRLDEEQIYEMVHNELVNGEIKAGLWIRAMSESYGNEDIAKSKYIKLRVQSICDEMVEKEYIEKQKRGVSFERINQAIDADNERQRQAWLREAREMLENRKS